MARPDGVLAVDVGTTGAKAVLYDPAGTVLARAAREYPLVSRRPGWAEQDPDTVVAAAVAAMAAAVAGAGETRIAGVVPVTAMHALLGLDRGHRPTTPLVTWADGRAAAQAARLRDSPAGRRLAARCGTPQHPMSPLAKLLWFRTERPDVAAATAAWVGLKEYLLLRLAGTGELAVDRSVASATGLYDLYAADWDPEALALAGIDRGQLARLVNGADRVGAIPAEVAAATGLATGTPVFAGGADGPLANLGVGAVTAGALACSIGTSAALRVTVERAAPDPAGRLFCYVLDDRRWVVGGATNNGGNVLSWLHTALAPDLPAAEADRRLLDLAAQAPPGSAGLLMLPYLAGERAPAWRGDYRGVYFGLTQAHRREHLVRAALEGVCLQLGLLLKVLRDTGIEPASIRATGGFASSPLWRQILTDVFGQPIGYPAGRDGTARGAALLGLHALGMVTGPAELSPPAHIDHPTEESAVYRQLLPLYGTLASTLQPLFTATATPPAAPS